MWKRLAEFVLNYKFVLLSLLLCTTVVMGFFASKVTLSYEFSKAVPVDNPKYRDYLHFKEKFGDDGNHLVIGVQTDQFFELKNFQALCELDADLKKIDYVENVLSVANAVELVRDSSVQKLNAVPVFTPGLHTQDELEKDKSVFYSLPFYKSVLYNPSSGAYLTVVRIDKNVLNSPGRSKVIENIVDAVNIYSAKTNFETHLSGLPLIRTQMSDRIKREMKLFVVGSLVLSALILLVMFRSVSTMLLSLLVVVIGVLWSVALTYLFGYKLTLLTALIPPLIVVIGIPNCIYFFNKYHSTYQKTGDKQQSLIDMVSKMGIVTLFCNLTAAIGFAVFALTKSAMLQEFGQVAGLSIMLIFVISFILLPSVLSLMPAPGKRQLAYLNVNFFTTLLLKIEHWAMHHKAIVYGVAGVVVFVSLIGISRLKTEGFIVDDLPKTDKIYKDLKFFEKNFSGVMPLEIIIDSRKKHGLAGSRILPVLKKMDSLSSYVKDQKEMSRPLSIVEGIKFVKQGFYNGDSSNYALPNAFDLAFVGEYLKPAAKDKSEKNNLSKLLTSFIDSSREATRMSINIADVGTIRLPQLISGIKQRADQLFDTSKYHVTLTGSTMTFLEGSSFIINGLKESILWAFLFISICMLYLFKSVRILVCSLIPNVIPLIVTAGIMGWAGVRIKPSTVLVFSIALGIAVDVTIRFLVNYKQELASNNFVISKTVSETIRQTGLSILYTSVVLIAGFVIFCFSGFGGTQSLGWLTSITLLVATLTNLILLPVLLLDFGKKQIQKH